MSDTQTRTAAQPLLDWWATIIADEIPAFEVWFGAPDKADPMQIFASGRIEGGPHHGLVINRISQMIKRAYENGLLDGAASK